MTFWDMFQTNENSLYARIAGVPMDPKGHIASRAAHPVQTPGLIGIVGDGDDNNVKLFRRPPYARLCIRGRSSLTANPHRMLQWPDQQPRLQAERNAIFW